MKIQEAMASLKQEIADIEELHKTENDPRFRKEHSLDVLKTITEFTEKVLGEPSEAMVEATITSFNDNGKLALVSHAKSYINQARKEVEGVD